MVYKYIFLLACFTQLACKSQKGLETEEVEYIPKYHVNFIENATLSELIDKAAKENKIVFLDFYADWCGPCKVMDNEVFNDKEVVEFFNSNFVSFKINAEKGSGPDIANLYNVKGYPTVVFIDSKGVLLRRQVGLIFQEQLMSLAEQSIELLRISS